MPARKINVIVGKNNAGKNKLIEGGIVLVDQLDVSSDVKLDSNLFMVAWLNQKISYLF